MIPAGFMVIAHRGASAYAPENTLAAFDLALDLGCRHLELDVDVTSDGHIVVMHDDTVDRTTNGAGPVGSQTLTELRALDAGAWFGAQFAGERIPTFAEVLEHYDGRLHLHTELKGRAAQLASGTADLVRQYGMVEHVTVTSFQAISPTTGEANLFTTHDDRLLERMRPQFALAKVRLAEDVLHVKRAGTPLKILDIGAGSGALAIDLIMAWARLGLSLDEITYEGLEPSAYMRRHFRANCMRKIGAMPFPTHWTLRKGSIEQVDARPTDYLAAGVPTVVVFSFSLRHCFHTSVKRFFRNRTIKQLAHAMFVLEVSTAHGWTKPYYMWADRESPENFHNILDHGIWTSQTLWSEPKMPPEAHAANHECCSLQVRT